MDTPICDFVEKYIDDKPSRLHMPGHKGTSFLGFEKYDITEISGADSLYHADGIIKKSEENATSLFGCPTYYSTEGASQCIRAMMYLLCLSSGVRHPLIAVGRNAHKTLISAAALLDFRIHWLCPEGGDYLSCNITPDFVENYLSEASEKPYALYVTSPDYLGNTVDIEGISKICHRHGVILAVDGAHGAYMHFLPTPLHPMDLGADVSCSSAHKTLPVLTGGAYLHTAEDPDTVRRALAMFGSTSPSYVILQSLDGVNPYLEEYPAKLAEFIPKVEDLKADLVKCGFTLTGDEPLKITLLPKSYGYCGDAVAAYLEECGIYCEFFDCDHLVMMLTPENGTDVLSGVYEALSALPRRCPVEDTPPAFTLPRSAMSVRDASMSKSRMVSVDDAHGRILASAEVGCPPAVPIVVCGEVIDRASAECMKYYGITTCTIVAE